jgi:hypothetical protein
MAPVLELYLSVADPDPGSGAFLPQGFWIRIRDDLFPDPGYGIPDPKHYLYSILSGVIYKL